MSVALAACVVLVSLSAGLLAVAACLWATRRRTSIPGPPTLPLLGNALVFYKLPVLWDRLAELHSRYGDIFRFYVGPKLVIVLTQPEDVKCVLLGSKPRQREPYVADVLRTLMGDGLLSINGGTWKRHRKNLEPAFHIEELEKFMGKFNDAGRFLCELLAEKNGTEVELYHPLMHTALRSAVATILDMDLEWILPGRFRQAEVVDLMTDFGKTLSAIVFRPWTTINMMRWMTAEGRKLKRFITVLKHIADRGIALASKNLDGLKASDRTLLTFLLKEEHSGSIFTDKEFRDEIVTLAASGVETTSCAVGYVLCALGLYPEWQDLAQRELDDYFGTGGDYLRSVTPADLANLKTIDAIMKETGRLFTTVPCMPYLVTEDTSLAGGRHVAPQGSTVLIAYYLMHRHPELFPEPDKFDPGRFLEGGSATSRKAYSYIPFGIGTRKCIGNRYAVLQMKVILATILRRYRILPGTSRGELEESVISISSHPITGFRVTCIPRENVPSSSV
ncbi:cytochrome P450 4C1-like [Schistocerca cancellata]|uniref:cytochrome P450 4C1-like n=1 Tax=Schistocerca cancellata TaxID=274614 RepID=UPI002119180B|nr:cytochrome P450 4C1-like [Schistocerca cancellata]